MLTPMDIEKKKFSKKFRGYSDIEVDEFLNLLMADYEKMYRENASLKDINAMITENLSKYKNLESTMQNTLIAAQTTGDEIKKNATEKAENIIKEAELRAREIIDNAANESRNAENRFIETKHEFLAYKIKATAALKAQLELLDSIQAEEAEKPPIKPSNEPIEGLVKEPITEVIEQTNIKADAVSENTAPLPKIEPEITFSRRNLSYDMIRENMLKTDA